VGLGLAAIALATALVGIGFGLCLWGLYLALDDQWGPVTAALGTGGTALLIGAFAALPALRVKR